MSDPGPPDVADMTEWEIMALLASDDITDADAERIVSERAFMIDDRDEWPDR